MLLKPWKIGLDIQEDGVRAVALVSRQGRWELRKWWVFPFPQATTPYLSPAFEACLADSLSQWVPTLPIGFELRVSFPASRTLQRTLPVPPGISGTQQYQWLQNTLSRDFPDLDGPLRLDYLGDRVTAVRATEVDKLHHLLASQRLKPITVSPDACALLGLLPFLSEKVGYVLHRVPAGWLWAGDGEWGALPSAINDPTEIARDLAFMKGDWGASRAINGSRSVDPWQAVSRRYPPLPPEGGQFAVALGLAISGVRPWL